MADRLKRKKCSEESWREMLFAMNKTSDTVIISVAGLNEVVECHDHYGGDEPKELILELGRKRAVVDRRRLFSFVNDHGEVCGKMK